MRISFKTFSLFMVVFTFFSGPVLIGTGLEIYTQNPIKQIVFDIALLVVLLSICRIFYALLGKLGILFGALVVTVLMLFRVTELALLYQFGTGFNDSFFVHLDPVSLKIATKDYPALVLLAAFMVTLLPIILYKLLKLMISRLADQLPIFALAASVSALVIVTYPSGTINEYSSTVRFVQEGRDFFAYQPIQVDLDEKLVKQLDINTIYSKQFSAARKENSKNLILVYLESFDLSFTDFGNSRYEGLTPNIDKFIAENTLLADHYSSETFTLAGIISSLCGFTPAMKRGNDSLFGTNHFQNVTCLTDILSDLNYEQVYFGGANKSFAGKADFLYTHQFDEVNGISDLGPKYEKQANWGLYDESLFNEAFKRIKKLAASEKPFNVTLLTLNTHIPGVRSDNCPKYPKLDDTFLHAVHCTDHDLGVFIEKLKKNNLLDDTVLVVTADHHVFRTRQIKKLFGDQLKDQRIVAAVRSPDRSLPKEISHTATYDLAPTILDLLRIEHNASFLLGESGLRLHTNETNNRTIVDRRNPRLKKANCDTKHQLDELCKARLTLAIQDSIVEQANITDAGDRLLACEKWAGINVRASRDSNRPSEVIFRGRDILNHVSEKGWPINRKTRHGIFFLSIGKDGTEDILRFFDVKKEQSAKKMREYLIRSKDNQLGILLTNGDASAIFDQESIKLFQQAGIKNVNKLKSGKPFVILFMKKDGVNYIDFHSVNNRFVEMVLSREKCAILSGEDEMIAARFR